MQAVVSFVMQLIGVDIRVAPINRHRSRRYGASFWFLRRKSARVTIYPPNQYLRAVLMSLRGATHYDDL